MPPPRILCDSRLSWHLSFYLIISLFHFHSRQDILRPSTRRVTTMLWFPTTPLSFSLSSLLILVLMFRGKLLGAQQFINFTAIDPTECVAPSAYLSCYEGVVENTAKCMNETSGNPTAQKGCRCIDGKEKINCFAEACWNRISDTYSLLYFTLTCFSWCM